MYHTPERGEIKKKGLLLTISFILYICGIVLTGG
jgi:hypothetical protein